MKTKTLAEGVLSNLVFWVVITMCGAVLAFLKVHWPQIAGPLLYGLAGSACVGVLCYVALGRSLLKIRMSPSNIESNLRNWSHTLGFGVKKLDIDDTCFGLDITVSNGNHLSAFVSKSRPSYLQFRCQGVPSDEHQDVLGRLGRPQSDLVTHQVALELSRSKIVYAITDPQTPAGQIPRLQRLVIDKVVPIEGMTEPRFIECVEEMNSAMSLVRSATSLALSQNI